MADTKNETEQDPSHNDDITTAASEQAEPQQSDAAETQNSDQGENSSEAASQGAEEEQSSEERLVAAQEELNAAKDQLLRAVAESQNAQRRAQAEVEKARKFAVEKFANDMLGVVDNLERAIEAAGEGAESPVLEGVKLTLKGLQDALKKHSVETVDPHGEPFDPELHQAMSMVPNPEVDPNTVIAVMQKGYTLNGRLLRPAMVMVSKAP